MNKEKYESIRARLLGENRFLKLVIAIIALSNVAFGYMAMKAVSYRTTVLVPFGLNEQVTVSDRVVNQRYLLFMARQIFGLALSYTPATVKGQYEMLLSLITPETYHKYKALFDRFVDEAETGKLVSVFMSGPISHDSKARIVMVKGERLLLLEGGSVVERKAVRYAFSYEIRQGRLFIKEIGEYKDGTIGNVME